VRAHTSEEEDEEEEADGETMLESVRPKLLIIYIYRKRRSL